MNRRQSGRCRSQPKRLTDLDLIPRIRRCSGKKKKLGLKAKEALRNEVDRRKSAKVDLRKSAKVDLRKSAKVDLKVAERSEKLSSRRRRNEEQESLESDSSWDDESFLLTMQAAGESARPTHVVDDVISNSSGLKVKSRSAINFPYSTCRLCARALSSRYLLDIFDPSLDLQALISTHLHLTVSATDCKPLKICHKCAVSLEKFDQFTRTCHATERRFNSLLSQGKSIESHAQVYEDTLLQELKDLAESFSDTRKENSTPSHEPATSQPSSQVKIKLCRTQHRWHLDTRESNTKETEKDPDDLVLEVTDNSSSAKTCEDSIESSPSPAFVKSPRKKRLKQSVNAALPYTSVVVISRENSSLSERVEPVEGRTAPSGDSISTADPISTFSVVEKPLQICVNSSNTSAVNTTLIVNSPTLLASSRENSLSDSVQIKQEPPDDSRVDPTPYSLENTPCSLEKTLESAVPLESPENPIQIKEEPIENSADDSVPCSLNPTPCSLNPTPCSLDPTPCSLDPKPCSLLGRPLVEVLNSKTTPLEERGKKSTEKQERKSSASKSSSHFSESTSNGPSALERVDQIEIKEEPDELHIDDTLPEDDMYESNRDYGMGSSNDGYFSYGGGYCPPGTNESQSSYESQDAYSPYIANLEDSKNFSMDSGDSRPYGGSGDMMSNSYHLQPRKRGRPKGSKNKSMTPQPTGGRKVFINDQYEVNFMHECRLCGSQFSDVLKHSLETHMSLECPCCADAFSDRPTLVEHFQTVHNTKSQVIYFPCPLCPDKLRVESELQEHVKAHADTLIAPYECFSCDFSDGDFMVMAKHIVEQHCEVTVDNRYECPICEDQETMSASFDALCNHLYEAHIPEEKVNLVACPVCSVQLGNDSDSIQSHLLTHTSRQIFIRPKYYRCPACNAGFKSQINLVKHACPNIINNRCEKCDISFPSKMRHTFHLQHHLDEPMQLKCDICFTDFDDESSLYDHVRFIHVQDNQLKCAICHKENFKNQLSLSIHMRYHENVREYECETCGKKFINKSTLKEHSVSHMRIKPFKCEICGHYLSRASRLRAHLKAHSVVASNNKVQSCKKCFRCCQVFPSNEENLRKHLEKVHLDTGWDESHFYDIVLKCVYRCEFCDSCFNETHELNRHRAANHSDPESPTAFTCLTCGVAFPAYSRLTTHKLTHGINTESLILTDEDDNNDRFRIVQYFLCELCDKTSIHYTYLCLHKKLKHSNLTYGDITPVCDPCNVTFKNEWQYLVHNRTVHEEPSQDPHSLGSSSVLPTTQLNVRKTAESSSNAAPASTTCRVCNKTFSSKENCRAHFLRQHVSKNRDGKSAGAKSDDVPVGTKSDSGGTMGKTVPQEIPGPLPKGRLHSWACEICEKTYSVEHSLLSHYDMHSGEMYQCTVCFKEFRSSVTLRSHGRRHENFACDECSVVCQDLNALRMHTIREHGDLIFSCEKCERKFTAKDCLAEHIAKEHNTDPPLKCVLCNAAVLFEDLEQHAEQEQHKVLIISCESCTKKFDSYETLSEHLQFKHSNQFLMKCSACKIMVSQENILPHLEIHKPAGSPASTYECNQCDEKKTGVSPMLNHYSSKHYMDVHMKCTPCDMLFHNKAALYKHLYLEHKGSGLCVQCKMCSLTFDWKESIVSHISAAHTPQISCSRCSSTFPSNVALNKHMKIEHCNKAYQCNECPEKFERLNKLKRHKFTVHNDSLHQIQCPYCITDFSEDKNLIQHILSVHMKQSVHVRQTDSASAKPKGLG